MALGAALATGLAKGLLEIYVKRHADERLTFLDDFLKDAGSKKTFLSDIQSAITGLDDLDLLDLGDKTRSATDIIPDLLQSIRKFQTKIAPATVLEEMGVFGPLTLRALERCEICPNIEESPDDDAPTVISDLGRNQLGIHYDPAVDLPPVADGDAHVLLKDALEQWSLCCGVQFLKVDQASQAHILVRTVNVAEDSPRNKLAVGQIGGPQQSTQLLLKFDNKEVYVADVSQAGEGVVFSAVALHELGHNIGIRHGDRDWPRSAVMHPTYEPSKVELTGDDRSRAVELWGSSNLL